MNLDRVEEKKYIVGIYMRLSKEDGDKEEGNKEESESITNQRKILTSFVKENNYSLYDEYVDDGYSGTNFNRPDFQRLLCDIKEQKINMVITKNLARLGRDYIETGKYIEKFFPENGIRYIAVLDDVDTFLDKNCDTVAFKNIMNDFYAKETSKNIKKTKNRKKKEGFYYITYAPYGYKKIDKQGKLEIDIGASEIIQRIFREFISGKGTYQIAKLLTSEKIPTPGVQMNMVNVVNHPTGTTNIWRHETIKRILENPVYIGTIVQNKKRKISYKSKKMIDLPKEQHTVIENHHPAIIDIETWNTAQDILGNNTGSKIKEEDPLLKSFLYCSHCSNRLQTIVKHDRYKDKVTIRRYVDCRNGLEGVVTNKKCYKQYINYDKLEEQVLGKITEIFKEYLNSKMFDKQELIDNLITAKSSKGRVEEKYRNIKEQLDTINKKIKMLYNDRLNGLIEEQDYRVFSENMINERHRLEKLKEETEQEFEKMGKDSTGKRIGKKVEKLIKELVEKQDFKKEDLQELVQIIEIDKDKNIWVKFKFYELNCIEGYFSYDTKQAVNS